MRPKRPRVLFYDVECTPNTVYTWPQGRKYDLQAIKIVKSWELLSFSYSWEGESVIYTVTRQGQRSDKELLKKLLKLMNSADVLVAHNGDRSDQRRVRTRSTKLGLNPLSQVSSIDTCTQARRLYQFDGNSLGDLAEFLGVGRKLPHAGFPMWEGCMADVPGSWAQMVRYNAHDVRLLKRVFARMKPQIYSQPNMAKLSGRNGACPSCTSMNIKKDGFYPTKSGLKQRLACRSCGHPFQVLIKRGGIK